MNKEEHKEYYRKYYQEHREELLKHSKEYNQLYQPLYLEANRQLNIKGGIKDTRELKKCITCKEYLPLSSFSRNIVRWDGLEAYCRQCNVEKARHWREKNKEHMNEIVYASSARYPERIRARQIAGNTFPQRQICIIKSCEELGERHHNNYINGKEIIWLCKKHHNLLYHNNRRVVKSSVV